MALNIFLFAWAWLAIGGYYWYRLYPDSKALPNMIFLVLWPFLTIIAFIVMLVERYGGNEEDETD